MFIQSLLVFVIFFQWFVEASEMIAEGQDKALIEYFFAKKGNWAAELHYYKKDNDKPR